MSARAGLRTVATGVGALRVEIAGSGPPALLWHSLFVGSRQWDAVAPAAFTLDGCAGAAARIVGELGTGAVDWVGNAGVIAAGRHLPPLENPAAVIDRVPEFWARTAARDDQEHPT